MPQVEDIKVLNVDGTPYAVDGMSDEVKGMVDIFNGWSRKEADAIDELTLIRAAKNDLSRQIILQVRKEKEEAEAQEGVTEDAPEATAEAAVDGE
jgi:hypothetical protein